MPYAIVIKRQAKRKLQSLPRPERFRIAEKIELLGANPDDPNLDVKKLEGEQLYRLRVGSWRVIFDRQAVVSDRFDGYWLENQIWSGFHRMSRC